MEKEEEEKKKIDCDLCRAIKYLHLLVSRKVNANVKFVYGPWKFDAVFHYFMNDWR